MDIWQAMNSTPLSMACWRRDSSESTPFSFIRCRIIFAPMPSIFILDNFSFRESDGSIQPNILPKKSFCTAGFRSFLMAFSPQNVKNMVTFSPVAAAPLARTNVAKVLSRSSLNRIKVLPFLPLAGEALGWGVTPSFLMMRTRYTPFSSVFERKRCPVVRHHASASRGNPASVALISRHWPGCRLSMPFFSFRMGPGHCTPQASTLMTLSTTGPSARVQAPVAWLSGADAQVPLSAGGYIGVVAALYVLRPPIRLRTFLNPLSFNRLLARYPRRPMPQYTHMGLSRGILSRCSRNSSSGRLMAPGIAPNSNSSAVRTSTKVAWLRSASFSSRQYRGVIFPLRTFPAT